MTIHATSFEETPSGEKINPNETITIYHYPQTPVQEITINFTISSENSQ